MRRRDLRHIPPEIMELRDKSILKKFDTINTQKMTDDKHSARYLVNNGPIIRMPIGHTKSIISYNTEVSEEKYVTANLVGGIGNRIFQVLVALGYSENFNMTCVLSKVHCKCGGQEHEKNINGMLSKIFPNIKVIDRIPKATIIVEYANFMYKPLNKSNTNVILVGYFQNENYFPSSKQIPVIRTTRYPNTYFLHIRAGDYIGNPVFHINLYMYYQNCINMLGPDTKYIVFSNDNAYATEYLKNFNIDYILSDKTDQLEVLVEMANCEGGICANSSFSWMGAFFQDKSKGKRFMPSVWLNATNCSGVYPKWATVVDVRKIHVK